MKRRWWNWAWLAWKERNTDSTTHEAWGEPAYERVRGWFLWWKDRRAQ